MTAFIQVQKEKQLLIKVALVMCFNLSKHSKIFRKRFRLDYYSVIDYTISISKYDSLAEISYNQLPKQLDHPRKGLINIQNTDDNECLKWSLVR